MAIKINVPFNQKDEAKKLGAVWIPDVKTGVIPNNIQAIDLFKSWLPEEGGSIVKYPYLVAKSERQCWKCRKDTPLIGLCAKNYFTTAFNGPINIKWEKRELPVFFVNIWSIDNDLTPVLKERFPFLQPMYSKKWGKDTWVNTCIHCQTIQGDDYNIHTWGSPFGGDMGKLLEFKKTEVLQLRFDYYIDSAIYEGEYHYDSSEEEDERMIRVDRL